jgi:pimeloyl-ACP methyl ester carboxylesterase
MAQDNHFQGDVLPLSLKLRLIRSAMAGFNMLSPTLSTHLMLRIFLRPRRRKNISYGIQSSAKTRRVNVFHNTTKLTGWVWGEGSRTVMLIHGWEGHTGRMIPMVQPLLDQGFRVFAFDAPGHGMSPGAATHLIDYQNAIQNAIQQDGPLYGIVAHSFGALAVTLMLRDNPMLMPEKLVLLSPMRDLDQHLGIFAALAGMSPVRKARLRTLLAKRFRIAFIEQYSAVEAVRSLKIPGLVIHDQDDLLTPYDSGQAVAHHWPDARLIATRGLGHQQGLKDPFVIQTITDYLMDKPDTTKRTDPHLLKVSVQPVLKDKAPG